MAHELLLIGRDGCHLCDEARAVVTEVVRDWPDATLREVSIDDDERLRAEYADEIPVLLIDGRMHAYWQVDPERLRAALRRG